MVVYNTFALRTHIAPKPVQYRPQKAFEPTSFGSISHFLRADERLMAIFLTVGVRLSPLYA